jgi:hypothetical protein
MSTAVVTLKLTSEQFRNLRREMEYLKMELTEQQDEFKAGSEQWQALGQRIMEVDQLLRVVL